MTDMEQIFFDNKDRVMNRYPHHLMIYDRFFSKFRGQDVCVLEIGSGHGGGGQVFKKYFGAKALIFGIDQAQQSKQAEEERFKVFIGRQEDIPFLKSVIKEMPKIDIVIDDGSHIGRDQIATFEELFLKMSPEAVYAVEDTHTSYRATHEGGYKKEGTFIEYCKDLVETIHARGMPQGMREVTEYTDKILGVYFYESLVIIEKSSFNRYGPIVTGTKRTAQC